MSQISIRKDELMVNEILNSTHPYCRNNLYYPTPKNNGFEVKSLKTQSKSILCCDESVGVNSQELSQKYCLGMEDANSRPHYEESIKATDTTAPGFQLSHNNPNDLFKEDSESSDQAVIPPQHHLPPELDFQGGDAEHDELRKFMKKADQLNEINYRKLQLDRSLVPEASTLHINKSNKNILEQISGDSAGLRRDRQIKQIYLGRKQTKRRSLNHKNLNKTTNLHHKRRTSTSSKEVQTESNFAAKLDKEENFSKPTVHGRHPSLSINRNSLKAIEEDADQDFIPQKRKHKNRIFNTISLTGETVEQVRHKNNANKYLQNLSKVQHTFTSSLKRYDFKEQTQMKTFFHANEPPRANTTFLRPIVNAPFDNPWQNLQPTRKESRVQQISPLLDGIDGRHSGSVTQQNSTSHNHKSPNERNPPKSNKQISTTVNNEAIKKQTQDKIPQIPKIGSRKKSFSMHSTFHAPTENSMMVEQNNTAAEKTSPSQYSFTIQKGHTSSNFYESKFLPLQNPKPNIIDKKDEEVQAPQIRQIAIGTDTNNFVLPKKGPIHPININFTQSDAGWITAHYKPKSEFIRKMDMKNFDIKKYKNGVYFGQISEDGLKHGKGVVFYFNGRSYQGNFFEDSKDGKGYEYLADGSIYKGDYKNGLKEGKGTFQWQNGQIYDGQWVKGKKNGSGMWKSPNGDSYIGEWKNGKVEGFGVLVLKEGDRYEGQFRNSMKYGLGTQRYANGDTYVGEFCKNRPNGQGEFYFSNGDYFKGSFSNGLKHGEGYLKQSDGMVFQGEFRNDKRSGYGELFKPDGSIYRGNFQNDLQHGYGEFKTESSVTTNGYWINGKKVEEDMEVIQQDELERQESLPAAKKAKINQQHFPQPKPKKKAVKRSPKASPKRSIERELSPQDPNFHRSCGCRRKH